MVRSFRNAGTRDVFDGTDSKAARATCPADLLRQARRRLDQIDRAAAIDDLRVPRGNRLEKLSGDRKGQWSVRISNQYRVCFEWRDRPCLGR
jgi:proteic killer suppression protein